MMWQSTSCRSKHFEHVNHCAAFFSTQSQRNFNWPMCVHYEYFVSPCLAFTILAKQAFWAGLQKAQYITIIYTAANTWEKGNISWDCEKNKQLGYQAPCCPFSNCILAILDVSLTTLLYLKCFSFTVKLNGLTTFTQESESSFQGRNMSNRLWRADSKKVRRPEGCHKLVCEISNIIFLDSHCNAWAPT